MQLKEATKINNKEAWQKLISTYQMCDRLEDKKNIFTGGEFSAQLETLNNQLQVCLPQFLAIEDSHEREEFGLQLESLRTRRTALRSYLESRGKPYCKSVIKTSILDKIKSYYNNICSFQFKAVLLK